MGWCAALAKSRQQLLRSQTGGVARSCGRAGAWLELEADRGDPSAAHRSNDQLDVLDLDAVARRRTSRQAGAHEIGKGSRALRLRDREAVERRDPAEQHLAGESEAAERHCRASPLVPGLLEGSWTGPGSSASLVKSSRTLAISFCRRGSRASDVVARSPIR